MSEILTELGKVLEDRKQTDPSVSYVAGLYSKGRETILKKIGEEATELVMAGKTGSTEEIIHEAADLWFHTLVLLAHAGLGPADVLAELDARFGTSGLDEKANRSSKINK